jgi:asparagine synthase (glutamine-hydrolysing)
MCGFAATMRRGGPIERGRLDAALARLAHRGPDARGVAFASFAAAEGAAEVSLGVGHIRLSILDLDRRSDQPFRVGGDLLAYNGEIYNFRELGHGMPLSTGGDTEVLLRLLRDEGLGALRRANGMWAFCWLDAERRRAVAARDRYGKKPLFYAVSDDVIHLASEPSAIAALAGGELAILPEALDRYMVDGWLLPDPTGATHLAGIREVRPGHALVVDLANWTLSETRVVDLPEADPRHLDAEALETTLGDAVAARLVSDRKVGLFLSGGVDSSLILSVLAARGLLEKVFCITGDAGKTDDAAYASACVDQLGIAAIAVPLPYDAIGFDAFLDVCRAQAKPFPLIGNVLGMHSLYKAAAQHDIPVVLDGSGADEVFGGYWQRYFGFALRDAEAADDARWIADARPAMPASFRHFGPVAGWMPGQESLSPMDPGMLRPEARRRLAATPSHDPLVRFGGTLAEALRLDATAGRMQEWLWQNDRNAMASGIENRSPFLDWRLASWMATPYSAKFGAEWNKRELRAMFERFVPLPTARRSDKQGFRWRYTPFFRNNREPVLAMIAASSIAARYVDTGAFADAVRSGALPFDSRLLHRLTVIAGLEAVGMTPA